MIYYDVTKSAKSRHASGLMRVNRRLAEELEGKVTPVRWGEWDYSKATADDCFLTTETFDPDALKGFADFIRNPPCKIAALFPDAIPLKFPDIVWPHSVARHPRYMHALSYFDHVFAISEAVRHDLVGFWQWQGNVPDTKVSVLPLGADFDASPRHSSVRPVPPPELVCVGILEPRKNQSFLLDVATALWQEGVVFDLHIVGRVNPHFGKPIVGRINELAREFSGLHFHPEASDVVFADLLARARAIVFPTIAEGCGLPVLEALWRGLPCISSDLPVLIENTGEGGCLTLPVNDKNAWQDGLRKFLTDDIQWMKLAEQAVSRRLPTWQDSAQEILHTLNG